MKFIFGFLYLILTTSVFAQITFHGDKRPTTDFNYLESISRIEIEPLYKSFVSNVEKLYVVKCERLDISYSYRGTSTLKDILKAKCNSDKGSLTIKVVVQNSSNKTFIRALKVLPGKGMRSQF
jgi:hypothetical protein